MMYKIVYKEDDKFFSFLGPPAKFKYSLEYKIGEWTYPKIGKLFVFDDLFWAKYYLDNSPSNSSLIIFECECSHTTIAYIMLNSTILNTDNQKTLEKYWNHENTITNTKMAFPPYSTRYSSAIKLIKEIKC